MEIHHFSHEHRLILKEEEHNDDDDDDGDIQTFRRCNGCLDPISSSFLGGYYRCLNNKCEFFLHKFCAELPPEINHPLHSEHKLILLAERSCVCDGCNCHWENFTYNCSKCDFDLDVNCTTLTMREFFHKSHKHPLIQLRRPGLFKCDACNTKHEGIFYQCLTCHAFLIHKGCLLLPTTIKHSDHEEDHPLILAYSLPSQYRTFPNFCDICTKYLVPEYWVYYCSICRFIAHVNCAASKIEPFMSIFLPRRASKVVEDSGSSDVIRFPVVDQSVTLISHILSKGTNIVTEDETANQVPINHFSHDHPLILEVQDSDCNESSSKRKLCLMNDTRVDETICSACVRPIFATPFYRCANNQCNFYLHKCCAELPTEINQHPSHPQHSLILLPKSPTFFNLFECGGCDLFCNGFSYNCSSCNFYLDVQCGSLPNTIKHVGHHPNHLLSLRSKISNRCNACRGGYGILGYGCNSCDFELDSRCALLSHKVRHRYDEEHPFILTYYPVKYHSDYYYCDLCELPLNPKAWFYHCVDCDSSIHIKCLRPFYSGSNIKYGAGRTLEIESHQHPLALAPVIHPDTKLNNSFRTITNYSRCDKCRTLLYNYPYYVQNPFGFRCVECNFTLCYRCANLVINEELEKI